ncbi:MAG: nitroreductase family protein [Dehalococcoidia bacterium]|nr:nitroreductase family protein [Dehalococcoidia bacterium]
MEVFGAIRTILAVRAYKGKPIATDTVRRIVEARRLTGSYVAQAPVAIVIAVDKTSSAVSDASRAIQSMMLTAWSEGIGSNWTGFVGIKGLHSLLGVPNDLDIIAVMPFGYPVKTIGKGKKKRKALSEVAHREKFGQTFK